MNLYLDQFPVRSDFKNYVLRIWELESSRTIDIKNQYKLVKVIYYIFSLSNSWI